MSVNPGFGGQKLIPYVIDKIVDLKLKYPTLSIMVDGGIDLTNISKIQSAGANDFVIGSALFKAANFPDCINDFYQLIKGV